MAGFPKVGDQYDGRYRIVSEIGHGGMGVVYEALDTTLNRLVALKIVLPSLADRDEYHQRFAREATALAKIKSRNIVGIYDYGEDGETVFFATEYFPDGDLQSWLTTHGPLDRRAALALVAQVCDALADAHAAGVVHRDVKPGNVLLWSRPEGLVPYLADFGIAIESKPDSRSGLTRTGTLIGSPAYMAPERHFGHPADERGDIYSVGCLLWATLTGDAPYAGTDFQMMNSHINASVPSLGTGHPVDDRIDQAMASALDKDPARRTSTATALRDQLLEIVRDIDTSSLPVPLPPSETDGAVSAALVEDANRTQIRAVQSAPPVAPPGPPPTGPPTAATLLGRSGPDEGRPRRRGWLVAVLAAAAVAVVVGITSAAVYASRSGDDGPDPTTSPTESSTSPSTAPSPTTPDPPTVTATAGYRSVDFHVAAAAGAGHVEVNQGDGWTALEKGVVQVPTAQGGDKQCLQARAVLDQDGKRATSGVTKECGSSAPRTARLTKTTQSCYQTADNGYTGPCHYYRLDLTGFTSGSTPQVKMKLAGKRFCTDFDCRQVSVGHDGRLSDPHFTYVFILPGVADDNWVLDVDGVQQRLVLEH